MYRVGKCYRGSFWNLGFIKHDFEFGFLNSEAINCEFSFIEYRIIRNFKIPKRPHFYFCNFEWIKYTHGYCVGSLVC